MEKEHEGWFLILHFPALVLIWVVLSVPVAVVILFFKHLPHGPAIGAAIAVVLVVVWLLAGATTLLSFVFRSLRDKPKETLRYGLLVAGAIFYFVAPWAEWVSIH